MNNNQKAAALEITIELSTGEFSDIETPLLKAIVEAAMPKFLARSREGMASKLISLWAKEHGGSEVPWETAVDITAILTGMPDAERDRLISLQDRPAALSAASPEDILSEYWLEHYAPQDVCVLCGNSGIVDTKGTAFWPDGKPAGGRHWCFCPNGRERRKDTDDANPDIVAPKKQRAPDGYAYRYPAQHLDPEVQKNYPTEIRFTHGQEINGYKPIEAIPYFFGVPGDGIYKMRPRKLALHTIYADEDGIAELEALIRQAKTCGVAQAAKFANTGDSEATFIADSKRLNCPSCGGSGHVDDVNIEPFLEKLVERFLSWPLPDTVQPDGFYPAGEFKRQHGQSLIGTHLLNAEEAKAMILHLFAESPFKLWQPSTKQEANPAQLDIPLECSDLPGGN